MGRITVFSNLVPVADIPPPMRMEIVNAALEAALAEADNTSQLSGQNRIVARALGGNDLGLATQHWNEQVSIVDGTGNTYEISAIDGTFSTPRDRVISIYGVYLASSIDSVSGVRIEVGGRRSHQWDFQSVMHSDPMSQSRENRTMFIYRSQQGAQTPVVVPNNHTLLISHYNNGQAAGVVNPADLVFLGWVLEPIGGGGAELQEL